MQRRYLKGNEQTNFLFELLLIQTYEVDSLNVKCARMARKRCLVVLFSFKSGKIDRWYKQELKTLNENDYNFKDKNNSSSGDGIQAGITRNNQLAAATDALKKEYVNKLKEIGEKLPIYSSLFFGSFIK